MRHCEICGDFLVTKAKVCSVDCGIIRASKKPKRKPNAQRLSATALAKRKEYNRLYKRKQSAIARIALEMFPSLKEIDYA